MKLLIVTQKVDENDDILGFFHDWLLEFACQCEQVEVICLWQGKHSLPSNVRVHSLGKEKGSSKLMQLIRFKYYLLTLQYENVFVHMNPIYLVLAGWWWRLTGKKVVLWYTHKNVDLKLRIAEKFATAIATAARESFNLASKKVHIMGHGIDLKRFDLRKFELRNEAYLLGTPKSEMRKHARVLCVGRITPIKHQDLLVEAIQLLRDRGMYVEARFVGSPSAYDDERYLKKIQNRVQELNLTKRVQFVGSVANKDIALEYWRTNISVNLVPTGGLDKAVLESIAAGTPTLTTNKAFESLGLPGLEVCELSVDSIAMKIQAMLANPSTKVGLGIIGAEFSVPVVVGKILKLYE